LTNGENLQAYLDGKQLNYSMAAFDDSWVFTFNYTHSTHQISLHLESSSPQTLPVGNEVILFAIVALFGIVLVIETKSWLGQKEKKLRGN
jgi:hypothetical protein